MKRSISVYQLCGALLVCRMFDLITHLSTADTADVWGILLNELVYAAFGFLILLPAVFVNRSDKTHLPAVVATAYAVMLSIYLFCSYYDFDRLFTGVLFQGQSSLVFVATMLFAVFYALGMGLEALMRTATVIWVLFLLSFVAILCCSMGNVNPQNLSYTFAAPDWSTAFRRSGEYILFAVLVRYAKGNALKAAGLFTAASAILTAVVTLLVTGVLGEYATVQTYPYFLLASISEFSVFKRMESVHILIYVFMTFIRLAVFLTALFLPLAEHVSDGKRRSALYWLAVALIAGGVLATVYLPPVYPVLSKIAYGALPALVFAVILPLVSDLRVRGKQ